MKTLNSAIISALLIFISCKGNEKRETFKRIVVDSSTTFIKDIPPSYTQVRNKKYKTLYLLLIGEDVKQLNLVNLENGFDSLCLRIWLGHSMSSKQHVVSVQGKAGKWTGQLITILRTHYGENDKKPGDTKQIKDVIPKSGWEKFIKTILSYQITTLPDESNLKDYNGCGGDGLPFYFEISTKQKYRFYTYCNIEDNIGNFVEARNVDNIARLLETEFDFVFVK